MRGENLGDGANKLAPDEKNVLGKHRTAAQKKIANIAVFNFFAQRFVSFCEINGFIVFCQPYKTPNGSKKKEENKRVGAKNTERFGALAQRFTWFGDLHENID